MIFPGLSTTTDVFYTFRILRLLTTPWKNLKAYKLGLIDENGEQIKPAETSDEKAAYNLLHRLVFNLKKLLNKVPLGKTTLASYVAALYLLKEESKLSKRAVERMILEISGQDSLELEESTWYLTEEGNLHPGRYCLSRDIMIPRVNEFLAKENSTVVVDLEHSFPIDTLFGVPVFEAYHCATKRYVYVTQYDLLLTSL